MASFPQFDTTSTIRVKSKTGSHLFKVLGYSMTKGIGIGKPIDSDIFTVGGYNWTINYYPDGCNGESKDFISLALQLKSAAKDVKVTFWIDIFQQNGVSLYSSEERDGGVKTFNSNTATRWGYNKFVKRNKFEASDFLKDDAFTIYCTITVCQGIKLEAINSFGVDVPPSTLNQNLANLLESGKGADVRFLVKGEEFNAHRCVLAARSIVFNAMLFGCMKEKGTDTIMVDEIEAPVFKSVLYFLYSDSFYALEENQDPRLMAEHLLVAADRYGLERLRLMCEDVLCKSLDVSNAATTIIFAERHNCSQLKSQCLKFISSAKIFKVVALTPEFEILKKICPSVLEDIKSLELKW